MQKWIELCQFNKSNLWQMNPKLPLKVSFFLCNPYSSSLVIWALWCLASKTSNTVWQGLGVLDKFLLILFPPFCKPTILCTGKHVSFLHSTAAATSVAASYLLCIIPHGVTCLDAVRRRVLAPVLDLSVHRHVWGVVLSWRFKAAVRVRGRGTVIGAL